MIHGLVEHVNFGKNNSIKLSPVLKECASAMGFTVKIIDGFSDLSYMPIFLTSFNEISPIDPVEELIEEFDRVKDKKLNVRS